MTINISPPPGTYTTNQTITITGTNGVTQAYITTNGNDPVIVKTVAASNKYNPPKPYIQTIEDGRGRAVFDGSFPKFYNTYLGTPTLISAEQTLLAIKNAMTFLVNGESTMGKKILYLNDANSGDTYNIIDTVGNSCFRLCIDYLNQQTGMVPTLKTRASYGGVLNPTYAELMEYDIIFVMSSMSTGERYITDEGAANIAEARKAGKGIYVCTDNDPWYTTANHVVRKITDAHFEGIYDFSPGTTVQYNRDLFGPSPLTNGMDATAVMGASTSDSTVVQNATVPVTLPYTTTITNGYTAVKVAAVESTGGISFTQYGYNIGQPPIVELCDSKGNPLERWDQTNLRERTVYFKYLPGSFGATSGYIKVNDITVAEFSNAPAGIITSTWVTTEYSDATRPNVIKTSGKVSPRINVDLIKPVVFVYEWDFNRLVPKDSRINISEWLQYMNKNEFRTESIQPNAVLRSASAALGVQLQGNTIAEKSKDLHAKLTL